jgi:integrase
MQQKAQRPVQFEITEPTRKSVHAWIRHETLKTEDYLFPSRLRLFPHLWTRQYARIVEAGVTEIGLDAAAYGTHTLRRTKASLIYRRTKNLRAVQLLLGHSTRESTVRSCAGIHVRPLQGRSFDRPAMTGWSLPNNR